MRVYVNIRGALDDGTVFDDPVERGSPLDFVIGGGEIPHGIEAGIEGMAVGETREFKVTPEEGFGAHSPDLVRDVAVENLPEFTFVGTKLSIGGGNKGRPAWVTAIGEKTATLDINHPLAGKVLHYSATLVRCEELRKVILEVITPGDGKTYPAKGDQLTLHYTGSLAEGGEVFDSSRGAETPFVFKVGMETVIKGWDQGAMQMSLGERSTLRIPHELAFGEKGVKDVIPPKADLEFDVELLDIQRNSGQTGGE